MACLFFFKGHITNCDIKSRYCLDINLQLKYHVNELLQQKLEKQIHLNVRFEL